MSKIIGRTTATPVPRSDWNQIDETKVDFIKNKPTNIAFISEEDNENITDVETGNVANAVLYITQILTDEQKSRARDNIGAASAAYVVSIFEELKALILAGDMSGAVAVLDAAILDMATLA